MRVARPRLLTLDRLLLCLVVSEPAVHLADCLDVVLLYHVTNTSSVEYQQQKHMMTADGARCNTACAMQLLCFWRTSSQRARAASAALDGPAMPTSYSERRSEDGVERSAAAVSIRHVGS